MISEYGQSNLWFCGSWLQSSSRSHQSSIKQFLANNGDIKFEDIFENKLSQNSFHHDRFDIWNQGYGIAFFIKFINLYKTGLVRHDSNPAGISASARYFKNYCKIRRSGFN